MKNLIFVLCLGISCLAHAENWQKIVSCENGAAVIDVNTDQRTNLQLVIKGNDLLSKLYQAGIINLQYGQQEIVIRGDHAELRQTSSTETYPVSLGGVFRSSDFKKIIWQNWESSAMEIELKGSDLAVKQLYYTNGTSCSGDFEGECQGAVHHRTYYFVKEYVLHGCGSL